MMVSWIDLAMVMLAIVGFGATALGALIIFANGMRPVPEGDGGGCAVLIAGFAAFAFAIWMLVA